MQFNFGKMSVEEGEHLKLLYKYRNALQENPEYCDPEVFPAALDFLNGRINEMKNEKAARPGDLDVDAIEASNQLLNLIIPPYTPSDKAVSAIV